VTMSTWLLCVLANLTHRKALPVSFRAVPRFLELVNSRCFMARFVKSNGGTIRCQWSLHLPLTRCARIATPPESHCTRTDGTTLSTWQSSISTVIEWFRFKLFLQSLTSKSELLPSLSLIQISWNLKVNRYILFFKCTPISRQNLC
jgi:hypothetical protein